MDTVFHCTVDSSIERDHCKTDIQRVEAEFCRMIEWWKEHDQILFVPCLYFTFYYNQFNNEL